MGVRPAGQLEVVFSISIWFVESGAGDFVAGSFGWRL